MIKDLTVQKRVSNYNFKLLFLIIFIVNRVKIIFININLAIEFAHELFENDLKYR